jgi:hypothetical protein
MFKMRNASWCLLLLSPAIPGLATTIQSTTYQSWMTQVTGTPTFEDVETLPTGNYSTVAGVNDGSYVFTGPDGLGWNLHEQTFGSTSGLYGASDGSGGIEVTLPGSGQSAIYFDANTETSNYLNSGALTLTLSDGEAFNISSGQFGLSISHNITWYKLSTTSGLAPFLQWAYFGNSALPADGSGGTGDPAPSSEAATVALVGGGILVLFGAKRKLVRRLAI